MRAVIQRTIRSSVTSEGTETGRIGAGLTVLLGVGRDDDEKDVVYTADKILNLRIFEDEEGNEIVLDIAEVKAQKEALMENYNISREMSNDIK